MNLLIIDIAYFSASLLEDKQKLGLGLFDNAIFWRYFVTTILEVFAFFQVNRRDLMISYQVFKFVSKIERDQEK